MTLSHDKLEDEDVGDTDEYGPDLRGDPSMSLVPAMDQYLSAYTYV